MEMRYLGKSGLKVSVLGLGCMIFGTKGKFGEVGNVKQDDAKKMVDMSLDSGVNFFDTANVYSSGDSEVVLGKALGPKRKNAVICTKSRFSTGTGPNNEGSSRYHIINACHESLKRLNTDYIDIYMLHSMDMNTPVEETIRALDDLVRHGKVRYIGCSNFSSWHLMKALGISDRLNFERFITYQAYYSLLARDIENEIVPACLDQGLGIMVWSPLSGGYLSGKFRRGNPFPTGTRDGDQNVSDFMRPVNEEKAFKIIDVMEKIANSHNCSIPQVAINYLLSKPAISTVLIGTRKIEQLRDNLSATDWKLSETEILELDRTSGGPLSYPYWHHKLSGIYK